MFNDAVGFKKIFLKVGYTDLRKGIPILMRKMSFSYSVDVRLTGSKDLFLKEMDSALSINGFPQTVVFQWPRSEDELKEITPQQFKWLMEGLTIMPKKKIKELVTPPEYLL